MPKLPATAMLALLVLALVPATPAGALPPCNDTTPHNDCIQNAVPLTQRYVNVAQSTTGAGTQEGEPLACDVTATVWYKFTALRNSSAGFNIANSDYSAIVNAYELQPDGSFAFRGCAAEGSWLTFTCVAGRDYYIQIGGEVNITGVAQLFGNTCQLVPEKPSAPQSFLARPGPVRGAISLSWSPPKDDGGANLTAYELQRSRDCVTWTTIHSTLPDTTSHVDEGRAEGDVFCYRVRAHNAVGGGSWSWNDAETPLGVPPPTTGILADGGDGFIDLSWGATVFDAGSPITAHRVYASESPTGPFELAFERADPPNRIGFWTDAGLGDGVTRYYTARVVNAYGESRQGPIDDGRTWTTPSAPQDLRTDYGAFLGVELSWSPPVDDGGTALTKYEIWRGPQGGQLARIATVNGGTTTYEDNTNGLLAGYDYAVLAVNAKGASPFSERACGEGYPVPPPFDGC